MLTKTRKEHLLENYSLIWKKIKKSLAKRGGNRPVKVMAAAKYARDEDVRFLLENTDMRAVGENRLQDAQRKWTGTVLSPLRSRTELHFIGRIQSNKAKKICEFFDFVDSLDSMRTAEILDRHCEKAGKRLPVLIQVKLTDSSSQSGISLEEVPEFAKNLFRLENLVPGGIMAIAPVSDNPENLREVFAGVNAVYRRVFEKRPRGEGSENYLSMGMSSDFETAVEEGANLPRIGHLLFTGPQ